MRSRRIGLVAAAVGLSMAASALAAEHWEGAKLTPTTRQEVYEFTRAPTFRKVGPDRYEIAFATKAFCDVAVSILDPAGKVVKHVVYGVLGANAPAPLKADSLEQTLAWDGKDDFGEYARDPDQLQVRVSLGLDPAFDRVIGWHPKDMTGRVNALGADADGVYVSMVGGYFSELRAYHHDGSYKRTLFPFPADKLDKLKGLSLQPIMLTPTQRDPSQPQAVPRRGGFGEIAPYEALGAAHMSTILAVRNGVIHCLAGGADTPKRVIRIGTDGSTGGVDAAGPNLSGRYATLAPPGEMAVSPDGKWLYMTRLIPLQGGISSYSRWPDGPLYHMPHYSRHAVYRIPYDSKETLNVRDPFLGEGNKKGVDNDHFDNPEGIALDGQGRIYVADAGNNRIQVYTGEGQYVATVPAPRPRRIAVSPKTGEIYVSSYEFDQKKGNPKLLKLSALPGSKVVAELEVPLFDPQAPSGSYWSWDEVLVWCLDAWAPRPRLWIAQSNRLRIWEDRGDKFEFVESFDESVRKDGYQPHRLGSYKMQRLTVDQQRGHLYYIPGLTSHVLRMDDPAEGKAWKDIDLPSGGGDGLQMGFDGLFYCRAIKWVARFDPDSLAPSNARNGQGSFVFTREVPFDYGESVGIQYGQPLKGAIPLPAMRLGCGFNMGMGVAPNGNVLVLGHNFQDLIGLKRGTDKYFDEKNPIAGGVRLQLAKDRYMPAQYPGRLWKSANLVFVYDKRGELIGEDAVPSLHVKTTSIRGDRDGNIYLALPLHAIMDGKEFGPYGGHGIGPGVVAKFPPTGGRFVGTWGDVVKLDPLPDRPPDFSVHSGFGEADVWARDMLWSVGGMSTLRVPWVTCLCPMSRMDVDWFGRVFIPETWRFSVNVVDTNGNHVTRVGRYGNAESGAGPKSAVPVPGGVAFSQCDFLASETDRWLYVNDAGNHRIVRVKLGYRAERTAGMEPAAN